MTTKKKKVKRWFDIVLDQLDSNYECMSEMIFRDSYGHRLVISTFEQYILLSFEVLAARDNVPKRSRPVVHRRLEALLHQNCDSSDVDQALTRTIALYAPVTKASNPNKKQG